MFHTDVWFHKTETDCVYSADENLALNLAIMHSPEKYNCFFSELVDGDEIVVCIHTEPWVSITTLENALNFIEDFGPEFFMFFFATLDPPQK